MTVFLYDKFVPEDQAVVSVFDRCFRYGDGLFEAILVSRGKMFRWPQHFARFRRSAEFLSIQMPYSRDKLFAIASELITRNEAQHAMLRLQLSRGVGPRGYAPTGEERPMIVMTLHPAPEREMPRRAWALTVGSLRVAPRDSLANHKTCSRLLQVFASAEARERGADECLIVNTNGDVTEGSTSNVFWIEGATIYTPPLTEGALPGITRAVVFECCGLLGLRCEERAARVDRLAGSDGVFLSLTSRGVVEVGSIDGRALRRSPVVRQLQEQMDKLLVAECS